MDKIKKFIDCYIPTETCNFRCEYCYITQQRKFNNELAKFKYSPEYIRKALSIKRLGGKCLINLCAGGETLLVEEIISIIKELLLEGHYVMIVTNCSLNKRFEEISNFPKELLDKLFFKCSFHYLELKRLNKLDDFFANIELMKKSGSSFTIEITPNDELEKYIDEIKEICMAKLGALPHITIARNDNEAKISHLSNHNFKEYINIWSQFNSEMLNFKSKIFYQKRKEFCYAGDWSIYLNLGTGAYSQCYCGKKLGNIYLNIDKKLKLLPIGNNCKLPHCYNGHVFLTLGNIPELDTPTYDILRNRVCENGSEWLKDDMKNFMKTKLKDSNEEYTKKQKVILNLLNISLPIDKRKLSKLKKKVIKNEKNK